LGKYGSVGVSDDELHSLPILIGILIITYLRKKMADSASEDERDSSKMSIKFKTTTDTILLEVGEQWAISKVKSKLAAKINQPAEKICLIFSGKILKDHENLSQHSK